MSFTPVVRTSNSIPKTLMEFAKDRDIDIKYLDFELLSFETLIKRGDAPEYEVVQDISALTQKELFDENNHIHQEYSIRIFARTKKKPLSYTVAFGTNKLKTKAIVTIAKGSVFNKHKDLFRELKDLIYAKKLRAGLFIGLFEPKLNEQLKKLVKVVPDAKAIPKELKFTVALGIEPIAPVDAKLEELFKKEGNSSIIDGVSVGELIARYVKEKNGRDGRACNGHYIKVRPPKVHNLRPIPDDTVKMKDTKEFVEYYAKESGYVVLKGEHISISKKLELEGASFKTSANIDAGDGDKDVSVHIKHKKSHSEDAVGSGVNIDVKELNVDGSVGANVNIVTQELSVDAQTHRDAKMEVQNSANVKLHRGDLKANDAEIDMLETGKISAQRSIHIKKMLGGEAIAPIVKVDELLSNSTIIASELIEIGSINGEHNTLKIDPDSIESYHKDIEDIKARIKTLTKEIYDKEKDFKERYEKHIAQMDRIKTFQARIRKATKEGKTPMKQDMIRIKAFKADSQKLELEKVEVDSVHNEIAELEAKLNHMYEKDLHAKIVSHGRFDGHTKVVFVNLKTKEEITYLPDGNYESISLRLDNEDQRVIDLKTT